MTHADMTTNHRYAHAAHVRSMATPGIAAGPPIPPRRRVTWAAVLALLVIALVVGTLGWTLLLPDFYAAR